MIGLMTALLLSAQDPQWNCDNPQAQQEMNYCAARDAERADAELNTVYRTAIADAQAADRDYAQMDPGGAAAHRGEPGEEATLREAQRAWVAFRDAHCRMQSFEARGGSMQPMLDGGCRATLTRARTAELRGPECPGDAEQAAINACLNRIYTRVDAALNRQWEETLRARQADAEQIRTAQRAWLAYRDAQCASATPSVASADIQASEQTLCRTRLTEARTHELADLAAMGE
ncbi:lysozyme inhibitor LprI family protein [Allosphingosinicella sp.]|uniref:lysozyme inhibitor LprI family protein n=1 Tax=Allosphingosinicella sp. TaxID=2823234 RepID=UPI00378421D8